MAVFPEGYYTFRWDGPGNTVYVSTSDNWSRRILLEKHSDHFEKTVKLPIQKTLYKFVVDGNWTAHPTAPTETEPSGVTNNVLYSSEIEPKPIMSEAYISSVSPESTTAALAANVPKETNGNVKDSTIASVGPDASTAALAGQVPKEQHTPGLNDVPGGFPSSVPPTPANEQTEPSVPQQQPESQTVSIDPLPASETATNPINLQPGEPVPKPDVSALGTGVKLDKDSYERADASNLGILPDGKPVLPEVVTPAEQRAQEGRGVLDLPPITAYMIPESSLPLTGNASSAQEAGPEVPGVVKESQAEAHVDPEASENPTSVEKKAAVEDELKAAVPLVSPTAEGNTVTDVATGYAKSAAQYATDTVASVAAAAGITSAAGSHGEQPELLEVPEVVKDSQAEADVDPEASESLDRVKAKAEVEQELKAEVPRAPPAAGASITDRVKSTLEGAGALAGATGVVSSTTGPQHRQPSPQEEPLVTNGLSTQPTDPTSVPSAPKEPVSPADAVPEPVKNSQAIANFPPEASGVPDAVQQKERMEQELSKEVKPTEARTDKPTVVLLNKEEVSPVSAVSGPTTSAFKEEQTPEGTPAVASSPEPSTAGPAAPASPTSEESPQVEKASSKKSTEDNGGNGNGNGTGTLEKKGSKRKSIFGSIRQKLHIGKNKNEGEAS